MNRNITMAAAIVGVAAALGGCGNPAHPRPSAPTAGATASATAGGTGAANLPLEYARCMRAHGVPAFPNPVDGHITLTPGSGIDPGSPAVEAASAACAKYSPEGGSAGGAAGGGNSAADTASWRAFAASLGTEAAAGRFSGAVLVARDGRPLVDAGYGLADRAAKVANAPTTRFCIASIGKLFTAVAVGQLAEQGRLSLDAPVGDYLAGLPAGIARPVTITDLLDMTAGLGDTVLSRPDPPRTLAGMVALIAKERPQFKPGSRFSYSNDDYILLGAVIQEASGESYQDYLRQHIFGPAGMTATGYGVYVPARVPDMAHGYTMTGSRLADVSDQPQIANPSGGEYSTTGDLLKFAAAVLDHALLSPAMTATILAPRVNSPQPGGPAVDKYTDGFAYQQINGVTFVGHNGGTPGYAGQLDIYPGTGYVVVVLSNSDNEMVPVIQQTEAILTG
jgi:CubicO group peptidase (beta-lactamase class C family)